MSLYNICLVVDRELDSHHSNNRLSCIRYQSLNLKSVLYDTILVNRKLEFHHSNKRQICLRYFFIKLERHCLTILIIDISISDISHKTKRMLWYNTFLVVYRKLERHHSNNRHICLRCQFRRFLSSGR